ncbi:MAG: cobyrinate a,c-diamide synthase [Rhodospirillaceae bacterium]|jgi:cobyrinic acid a,c-diamide synthase|nr:cobyrinate a,c-diamide synthase [Rhodospirillaceae bacterium]MBT5938730.1 cobyrinate a,c-diamide synthase [Rhodospirillaceae bacterium]MBT7265427.1 cobyrinate a,c-diamide synthase [Rhodospirillaceae bacterium]
MSNSLLISAALKSSGKTTVTMGLCAALQQRGVSVQPFKKGPDYIDPMWLSRAAQAPCRNLDFFTMSHQEIVNSFTQFSQPAEAVFIEGNKGLFDGLDPEGSDSNSALARLLGVPIVLVVDTYGMTRGVAPLLQGYQSFESDIKIAGVILNKVGGPRHETKMRAAIEHYTDLKVVGAVGRRPEMKIVERHLGLVPANEMPAADSNIVRTARIIEEDVDVEAVQALAAPAQPKLKPEPVAPINVTTSPVRVGIARDAAFGFYYEDDLEALTASGAELVVFDALHDRHLPEVDGLFIGGGFPEVHMRMLSENTSLKADIRNAIENGLPTYAECGGLLYLAKSLSWQDNTYDMVGVIPGDGVMHDRPIGRGYVRLSETGDGLWPNSGEVIEDIPAHEFHYASLEGVSGDQRYAYKVIRGHGIDGEQDGLILNNLTACFAHQRNLTDNKWAENFVGFVRQHKMSRPSSEASQEALTA